MPASPIFSLLRRPSQAFSHVTPLNQLQNLREWVLFLGIAWFSSHADHQGFLYHRGVLILISKLYRSGALPLDMQSTLHSIERAWDKYVKRARMLARSFGCEAFMLLGQVRKAQEAGA